METIFSHMMVYVEDIWLKKRQLSKSCEGFREVKQILESKDSSLDFYTFSVQGRRAFGVDSIVASWPKILRKAISSTPSP